MRADQEDPAHEIAPPPAEHLVLCRAGRHGWFIMYDGQVEACFEDATGLARWIETTLGGIETKPEPDAMPSVLAGDDTPPRRKLWRVFSGGRE